ncbi:unnamed protein product [marine sediment metagenome]|uniref:Uncharacterized protein n=1 Tax=marine sediment metagenome TaxID=412755 RepID=X1IGP8_9ZZZZ
MGKLEVERGTGDGENGGKEFMGEEREKLALSMRNLGPRKMGEKREQAGSRWASSGRGWR